MKEKDIIRLVDKHNKGSLKKIVSKICGKRIGVGIYRTVYELKFDKRYVVKVEAHGTFTNALEWFNFIQYENTPVGKFLCPVLCISGDSKILVMRKAKECITSEGLPKKLPACFTDLKIENWGFIGSKPYIFDYPFLIADQRDRRVKYWSHND